MTFPTSVSGGAPRQKKNFPFTLFSPPTHLVTIAKMSSKSQQTYGARAQSHPNPLARKLFQVAEEKKSNVTVSADVTTTKELLELADRKPKQASPEDNS